MKFGLDDIPLGPHSEVIPVVPNQKIYQQSVGSSPGHDTCVLKQDTEPLLCPSDGT